MLAKKEAMIQKQTIRIGIIALTVFLTWLCANSALGSGNWGNSARAIGMGNAFVAVADDPSAIFYNSAGLANLKTWQMYFLYDRKSKYGLSDHENPFLASGAFVFPLLRNLSIGLSGSQRGSWADPTGVVTNNMGQLSLSTQLSSQISVGLSGKFLYNSNYGNKKGVDFDLGILFHPASLLWLGLAGENLLATDVRPDGIGQANITPYPTRTGRVGISYAIDNFNTRLAFDLILKNVRQPAEKTYLQTGMGIERWVLNTSRIGFALRVGYTLGKECDQDVRQPALGAGLRYKGTPVQFQIDYSWQKYPYKTNLKSTGDHRIAITIHPTIIKPDFKSELRENATLKRGKSDKDKSEMIIFSPYDYSKFGMDIRAEQITTGRDKYILFLLEPQADFNIAEWELYICMDKPEGINQAQIEPYLLKTLHGWAMPGFSVLWDLKVNGEEVQRGKYFYSLFLIDTNGNGWASTWRSFRVR